ncbi:MAG: hypothetical protein FWF06_07445, partial [Symbiobacteriaceae bacterium]|nr:hypothetical protein [Symbiobacteriaceae bacterium]
ARLTVVVEAIPLTQQARNTSTDLLQMGGILNSLSHQLGTGAEDNPDAPRRVTVLEQTISLTELSQDAIDLGFAKNEEGEWLAYLHTPQGLRLGNRLLGERDYRPLTVSITISAENLTYSHEIQVSEDKPLDRLFCTYGLNAPDISSSAVTALSAAVARAKEGVDNPEAQAFMRLYHRTSLYSFLASQTAVEDTLANIRGLVLGRSSSPRLVILTSQQSSSGTITTAIDLASPFNEVHNAQSIPPEWLHGFNIASGLAMCELEKECLIGENAVGFMELWELLPPDEQGARGVFLIPLDRTPRRNLLNEMIRQGNYPQRLLDTVRSTEKVIIAPNSAVLHNGVLRWVWLEIDPVTYKTITVFDSGEHGSFVEYLVVLNSMEFARGTVAGFYCGFVTTGMVFAGLVVESFDVEDALDKAGSFGGTIGFGMSLGSSLADPGLGDAAGYLLDLFGDDALSLAYSIVSGIMEAGGDNPLTAGFSMGFDLGCEAYLKLLASTP